VDPHTNQMYLDSVNSGRGDPGCRVIENLAVEKNKHPSSFRPTFVDVIRLDFRLGLRLGFLLLCYVLNRRNLSSITLAKCNRGLPVAALPPSVAAKSPPRPTHLDAPILPRFPPHPPRCPSNYPSVARRGLCLMSLTQGQRQSPNLESFRL